MNLDALTLPADRLLETLDERIVMRNEAIAARDALYGPQRVPVTSYMENIGWPELFGFDMNRFYTDPDFNLETQLRQKIFWADNVDDDSVIDLNIQASTGMYFDMTLFGQEIRHTPQGVPEFLPHPLASSPDLRPERIPDWDFHTSGNMPRLIAQYQRLVDLARERFEGRLTINFPHFHRGPMDVLVQMRSFDHFVDDLSSQPDTLSACIELFVEARLRFARERQRFLGLPHLPSTSFVADDWVNIPFISPAIFRRFALPAYRHIRANEGPVTGFHTCGNFERVVNDLLTVFPDIRQLEVSGWNDVLQLDRQIAPEVGFDLSVINTLVLAGSEEEQRARLLPMAQVSRRRSVRLCAQAMVKLTSYEDTFERVNRFINLAREIFSVDSYTGRER